MAERIDAALVRVVARLARLDLTDAEVERFSADLRSVLGYIEKMNELNTDDVKPLAHCLPIHNVFREDRVCRSLTNEQALANAPQRADEYFKVPRVLDGGGA